MSGMQTGFLDNLREAVRENPLAAALIGGGALWLLMGNERLKGVASSVKEATAPLADIEKDDHDAASRQERRAKAWRPNRVARCPHFSVFRA